VAVYTAMDMITHVLDMSKALEPSAGKFAVSIFFAGTLSAGLSSIFPCSMIVPLMLGDYNSGKLDVTSNRFKIITGVASVLALTVPVFGFNPIQGQIISVWQKTPIQIISHYIPNIYTLILSINFYQFYCILHYL